MAAAASGGAPGFVFRALGKPEEFRAAEELQRTATGGADEAPVPLPVLRAFQDHGGLVVGAFADIYLAALAVGSLGWDGSSLYQYLHRLVVRPQYQNHGLGRRLAEVVATEVRQQGVARIRGAVDPLSSRGAALVVGRLGARPDRYLVHYLGQSADPGAVDPETDRLRWVWELGEGAAPADAPAPVPPGRPEFSDAVAIVETEVGGTGLRLPTAVVEPSAPRATLEIPFDVDLVRQHEPAGARRWRHAARDAFRAAFDVGYRVVDFEVRSADHERRSFYLLEAGPRGPTPPAGPVG